MAAWGSHRIHSHRMNKLSLRLLRRFRIIANPFWVSARKRKAIGLLVILILLLIGDTGFNVLFNEQMNITRRTA